MRNKSDGQPVCNKRLALIALKMCPAKPASVLATSLPETTLYGGEGQVFGENSSEGVKREEKQL